MLLKSWAFDALAPVNKMLPATSKFPAGSLEVNGLLPQLYSIPQASQEDNMRTCVPSLIWIITLHCSWQLLHDDNNSLRQLSYTMYFLSRCTTSSWWSVISLKNIHNLSNYLSRYLGSNWECLFIIILEPEIGLERKQTSAFEIWNFALQIDMMGLGKLCMPWEISFEPFRKLSGLRNSFLRNRI